MILNYSFKLIMSLSYSFLSNYFFIYYINAINICILRLKYCVTLVHLYFSFDLIRIRWNKQVIYIINLGQFWIILSYFFTFIFQILWIIYHLLIQLIINLAFIKLLILIHVFICYHIIIFLLTQLKLMLHTRKWFFNVFPPKFIILR